MYIERKIIFLNKRKKNGFIYEKRQNKNFNEKENETFEDNLFFVIRLYLMKRSKNVP